MAIINPMGNKRPLTHDEKKASEAAFRGLPFDPEWSDAARSVYEGIVEAMRGKGSSSHLGVEGAEREPSGPPEEGMVGTEIQGFKEEVPASNSLEDLHVTEGMNIRLRRKAVEAGLLMDVTPHAQSLGIDLAVGLTKPLWDFGIASDPDFSAEEKEGRIRDMLLAVRLRLATVTNPGPIVQIPVLLSFPETSIPQVFTIFGLFHKDPIDADCLLLIHPGEVAFSPRVIPPN